MSVLFSPCIIQCNSAIDLVTTLVATPSGMTALVVEVYSFYNGIYCVTIQSVYKSVHTMGLYCMDYGFD